MTSLEQAIGSAWEGTYAWRDVLRFNDRYTLADGSIEIAWDAWRRMRVVWIGARQAEALEPLGGDLQTEMRVADDYAKRARPPFPFTFFDFRDADGQGSFLGDFMDPTLSLHAAVMCEVEAEPRWIAPFFAEKNSPRSVFALGRVEIDPSGHLIVPARSPEAFAALKAVEQQMGYLGSMDIIPRQAARCVLRVLCLLDSSNVDLAERPMSRQVRRESSRRGREIALTVTIRAGRQPRSDHPKNDGANWSHAFERRGHYNHVCKGQSAKPGLMTPCPVDDEKHRATGGVCRRVWIPPTVCLADRNLPLVIKTRRIFE